MSIPSTNRILSRNKRGLVYRLLHILRLVQENKQWKAHDLAKHFGVSQRTIYRDLDILHNDGLINRFDRASGGYQISREFFAPPVEFAIDEILALVALGDQIAAHGQIPFVRPAERAVRKVLDHLPQGIRKEIDTRESHLSIRLTQASAEDEAADVYEKIQRAIFERRKLKCRYDSAGQSKVGKSQYFMVRPYKLLFSHRAWYVVGFHERHQEVRNLKLSRFDSIEMTSRQFDVPSDFSIETHLGDAWRMRRGPRHDVEIWFDSEFADNIAETRWHATQQIQWQPNGSMTFRCTVEGLDEIVWWALSMGPHCVVKKPKELVERVCMLARQLIAVYGNASRRQ